MTPSVSLTVLTAWATVYAVEHAGGLTRDPGPRPALATVLAGMCFAGALAAIE